MSKLFTTLFYCKAGKRLKPLAAKLFIAAIALVFSLNVFGQTTLYTQGFNNNSAPAGCTTSGSYLAFTGTGVYQTPGVAMCTEFELKNNL